uniref:Uncharacterized protein n=1 Tax=Plectus sambesii TaxID=2011161 RepID=A0A914VRV7_9BILA
MSSNDLRTIIRSRGSICLQVSFDENDPKYRFCFLLLHIKTCASIVAALEFLQTFAIGSLFFIVDYTDKWNDDWKLSKPRLFYILMAVEIISDLMLVAALITERRELILQFMVKVAVWTVFLLLEEARNGTIESCVINATFNIFFLVITFKCYLYFRDKAKFKQKQHMITLLGIE